MSMDADAVQGRTSSRIPAETAGIRGSRRRPTHIGNAALNKARSAPLRQVALLIEASRGYARGLVRGIARYNREHVGWSVFFTPRGLSDPPPAWLKGWKGDGILARINDQRMAEAVLGTHLPAIDLRRGLPQLGLPTLGPDDTAVARMAFEHLLERGFRHFAFLGMPRGTHPPMDQRAGEFARLVAEAGCSCSTLRCSLRPSANARPEQHARMVAWLRGLPKPLGVMACNDDYGLQLLNTCRRAGIPVPDAVAVLGVGNDACLCNLAVPALSSIDLNPEQIGYEAAAMLERLMLGGPAAKEAAVVAPQGVVTRMSTDVLALEDHAVARAVRFIRARACNHIQASDVLKQVKMSRTALESRLKATLGRTIHQEILRVQLERVKQLLATTEVPIKQVAYRAGFRYPEYMMRIFRRMTGQTPAQYRKASRLPRQG